MKAGKTMMRLNKWRKSGSQYCPTGYLLSELQEDIYPVIYDNGLYIPIVYRDDLVYTGEAAKSLATAKKRALKLVLALGGYIE